MGVSKELILFFLLPFLCGQVVCPSSLITPSVHSCLAREQTGGAGQSHVPLIPHCGHSGWFNAYLNQELFWKTKMIFWKKGLRFAPWGLYFPSIIISYYISSFIYLCNKKLQDLMSSCEKEPVTTWFLPSSQTLHPQKRNNKPHFSFLTEGSQVLTVQLWVWIMRAIGWRQALGDLQLEQQHPHGSRAPISHPNPNTRAWESRVWSDVFLCILPPHKTRLKKSSWNFSPGFLIWGVSQPRLALSKGAFCPQGLHEQIQQQGRTADIPW